MNNNNKQLALFFGSLRQYSKRGYNHDRFGKGTQKYIKTFTLPGFEMYSVHGHYPTICKGDGSIVVELHEVEPQAWERISYMEKSAQYDNMTIPVEHNGKTVDATIYYWSKENIEKAKLPRVESGDWN
jgi:gamma-glutamylcyclotransferase (GGCT)/AIG2-like uncharacterized protein YtfP